MKVVFANMSKTLWISFDRSSGASAKIPTLQIYKVESSYKNILNLNQIKSWPFNNSSGNYQIWQNSIVPPEVPSSLRDFLKRYRNIKP